MKDLASTHPFILLLLSLCHICSFPGTILTWQSASIVGSAKRLAQLMPLSKGPILSLQQKLTRLVCMPFAKPYVDNSITNWSDSLSFSIVAGTSLWQREAAWEWGPLGNRDCRESQSWESLSLNVEPNFSLLLRILHFFHLLSLTMWKEINRSVLWFLNVSLVCKLRFLLNTSSWHDG